MLELGRANTSIGVDASGCTVLWTSCLHERGHQLNLDGGRQDGISQISGNNAELDDGRKK